MGDTVQQPLLIQLLFLIFIAAATVLPTSSSSPPSDHSPSFQRVPRFLSKRYRSINLQQQQQYSYQTRYFHQDLDHFSFADLPKFRQRYLINTEHWTGPERHGPIFLYCGNEGDIEWFAVNTGFVWEIAPKFGAMILFPEHRYYGDSMPYGSREEAYKNAATLAYLTAEQALADFAVLITDLKRNLSAENCPVVLFGGSYGGMLAAWMRLKYPHLTVGALVSSAPILQFEDIVPLDTFYNIVSNDFKRESTSCFDTIKMSWAEVEAEGKKDNGLSLLTKTFNFCRELKSTGDLVNWLESAYSYLAMVDYPYPSSFMMPLPGHPIREVCRKIDGSPKGSSILERIFAGVSIYYNYTGTVSCFELDDDPHGLDGWNWQACTEMVMPMSSDKETSMFPPYDFSYSDFRDDCWRRFRVLPRPKWVTTEFGGHHIAEVPPPDFLSKINLSGDFTMKDIRTALATFGSNMIFSNGLLDPWSGGSVLQNISETIVALVTQEGAHHIDLRPSTPKDPDWLIEQRETEMKLIQGWIDDYYRMKHKKATFSM